MDDDLTEIGSTSERRTGPDETPDKVSKEVADLREQFLARLIAASLRTDAVRAGILDLDGLKMIDLSTVQLGQDDKIIGGSQLMEDFRRNKPWLFAKTSSSSATIAPSSQPVRQKTALEMTDDEYITARTAVTKYRF